MHGRSKNVPSLIQKKIIIDQEKTAWLIQKKSMADHKKNFVNPDPAWNYAIPDFAIPFTFPLASPGQTKWFTEYYPHPSPLLFCFHHSPYSFVLRI